MTCISFQSPALVPINISLISVIQNLKQRTTLLENKQWLEVVTVQTCSFPWLPYFYLHRSEVFVGLALELWRRFSNRESLELCLEEIKKLFTSTKIRCLLDIICCPFDIFVIIYVSSQWSQNFRAFNVQFPWVFLCGCALPLSPSVAWYSFFRSMFAFIQKMRIFNLLFRKGKGWK